MKTNRLLIASLILVFLLLLSGCEPGKLFGPAVTPTLTLTPIASQAPTPMPTITPSPTPEAITEGNIERITQLARYGKGAANSWAYSPDGKLLAVGGPFGVDIYDASTLEAVRSLESTSVYDIAFSADGEYLAAGLTDTVRIWRVSDGALMQTLGSAHHMQVVAFSPDSKILAAGTNSAEVILWQVSGGTRLLTLTHEGGVTGVAFSADGSLVAGVSNAPKGNSALIWQVADGKLIRTLKGPTTDTLSPLTFGPYVGVAFSPDGKLLAAGSNVNTSVLVWRMSDGSLVQTLEGMEAAFSPDGAMLATTDAGESAVPGDEKIQLFDVADWSLVKTVRGYGLGFSPDWKFLAYSDRGLVFGDAIHIMDVATGNLTGVLEGYYSPVTSIAFSADGAYLASGHRSGIVHIWRNSDGSLENTFERKSGVVTFYRGGMPSPRQGGEKILYGVTSLDFSPDGQWLAIGFADATVCLWNRSQGISHALDGKNEIVAFSPDGKMLATGSPEGNVTLWQVSDHRLLRTLELVPNPYVSYVKEIAFSPDGKLVALASDMRGVMVWDVTDGSLVNATQGSVLAFTQDGTLWIAGEYGEARLWNTSDWSLVRSESIGSYTDDMAFSLAGNLLALTAGNTITLQQLSDGTVLTKIQGINPNNYTLAFSPDGALLAAGSIDGTVTLWGLDSP